MSAVDSIKRAHQFIRSLSLYNCYRNYTKTYIGFVTLAALIGYGYLLLFPMGVIFGSYQLYLTVLLPFDSHMLLAAVSWTSVVLFCAGITHGIATIKLREPEGIALARENSQLVFDRIEEIEETIKWPKIDNVILSRRFELNIIKTPRWYAPFWSKSTLVIGYPYLQTLSVDYYNCTLTRKIHQYAKRKNMFINWLSFLRSTWPQYSTAFKERNKVGDQISYWFFRFYSWSYRSLALYATQLDELQADELALNHLNDRDLFRAIESVRLVQKLLNEHYWPKLSDALARASASPEKIKPYEHLAKTTAQMMNSDKVGQWLKILTLEDESEGSHEPSFRERMDKMGYTKMCPLKPFEKTAAEYYLGPANPKLINHMNKLWAHHVKMELANSEQPAGEKEIDQSQQRLMVAF